MVCAGNCSGRGFTSAQKSAISRASSSTKKTSTPTTSSFTSSQISFVKSLQSGFTTPNNSNNSNTQSPINTDTTSQVYSEKQVPTSFQSTPQQQTILKAMEAQKAREQTMTVAEQNKYYVDSKPNKSTYTFNGVDVTAQTEKQLAIQRETKRINDQMSQDFKNRTTEQTLQNFIVTRINEEQTGVSPNTNLSAYVAERGYDVTKPEVIPTDILKPQKLDTPEKLIQAGLAPSLVNIVLGEKYPQNLPVTDNPQVQTMNIPTSQISAVTSNPQVATMLTMAKQIQLQNDMQIIVASQAKFGTKWTNVMGTSDPQLQLERMFQDTGINQIEQIREHGYPIGTWTPPKIVKAVVDIVVPPVISAVIQPEKQKTDTGVTVDTSVPARPEVNWRGRTDTSMRTINLPIFQRRTTNQDNLFNPPEAENTNQPVGALLPDTPIEKKSNLAIPLLAGSLLFMM